MPGPALLSSNIQGNSASSSSPSSSAQKSSYNAFSSLTSSDANSRAQTPISNSLPPQSTLSKPPDPFAVLSQPAQQPQTSSLFDFTSPPPQNGTSNDDDWNFRSALPEEPTAPLANDIPVSKTSVTITMHVSRPDSQAAIVSAVASFSNNTPHSISEYHFQIAVTKVSTFQDSSKTAC